MWINTQWDELPTVSHYIPEKDQHIEFKILVDSGEKNISTQPEYKKWFVKWVYPRYVNLRENITLTTPECPIHIAWINTYCFEIVGTTIARVSYTTESNVGSVTGDTTDRANKAVSA